VPGTRGVFPANELSFSQDSRTYSFYMSYKCKYIANIMSHGYMNDDHISHVNEYSNLTGNMKGFVSSIRG
jgi:hypothetical protein